MTIDHITGLPNGQSTLAQQDDLEAFKHLKTCLRHVQNGTDATVKISKDDATRSYILHVGNRRYWAYSLHEVLARAASDFEQN